MNVESIKTAALAKLQASEFKMYGSAIDGNLFCYVQRVHGFTKTPHYRYTFKRNGKVIPASAL